jgi:hypothetical protein
MMNIWSTSGYSCDHWVRKRNCRIRMISWICVRACEQGMFQIRSSSSIQTAHLTSFRKTVQGFRFSAPAPHHLPSYLTP